MTKIEKSYQERLNEWEKNRFKPSPEPALCPAKPTLVIYVSMRDEIKLYTEIYLPAHSDKPLPTILVRSPYPYSRPSRHDKISVQRYLEAGYVFVFQLTRGQGESEGIFHRLSDDGEDGYDCIEWLAQQSWCNGRVGMQGVSYLGGTQLMAARKKPLALKCIMPSAFVGNSIRSFPFSCGVPNKGPYMQWCQLVDAERCDDMDVAYGDMSAINHPEWGAALRKRPLVDAANEVLSGDKLQVYRETISNPMDNEYWKDIHFTDEDLEQLEIPMFFTDGWYDMTIGPIDFFSRLEKIHNTLGPDRYLLVGPWNHSQTFSPSQPGDFDGDRTLPNNGAVDLVAQRLAFFDRYLKEDKKSIVQESRVRVYITGSKDSNANKWINLPTFPAPGAQLKRFYLHSQGQANNNPSDGVLDERLPTEEPVDSYLYDPSLPTASLVETSMDRRQTEIRTDVLTYTTAPLVEPMTILGDITLVLYAASDAPDTDWFAVITEVFPDGESKSFHYTPPAFRARYREGFDREVFLTPNKPEEFRMPMGPAGHQIAAGNCIRLSIFSAAFPEYDPNSNTGNEAAMDTQVRIARQTIYHDANRPSCLILPVIQSDSF